MPVPQYPPIIQPCIPEQIDTDTIHSAMAEILKRLLDLYTTAEVVPPARRLWSLGAVSAECDELVVLLNSIAPEEGDDDSGMPCASALRMSITITVSRCVPVSSTKIGDRPPTPKQLADAAAVLSKDAWILAKAPFCLDLHQMKNLEPQVLVDDPQGGMQSVSLDMSMVI